MLSPRTALLVQALKRLGESGTDTAVMGVLREKFSTLELNLALKEARYATTWVYSAIKQITADGMMSRA